MKKTALLGITALSIATLYACSNSKNDTQEATSDSSMEQTSTSTTDTSISVEETKRVVREVYDSVVIGDLMSNGEGGTQKEEVLDAYGTPASSSTIPVNGLEVEQVTWVGHGNASGITVSIQFINNSATSKMISGFQFTREAEIGLTDFNNLVTGTTYEDVINTIGEPDTTSESLIAGSKTVTASWISGVKGSIGANFMLQFVNDTLSTKSQAGLSD